MIRSPMQIWGAPIALAILTAIGLVAALLGVEMAGYGFGFVGVILFIMQVLASGRYQAAHYALGTGFMQLGFVLFRTVSGDIQAALGYRDFFVWVLAASVPVLVLSRFMRIAPADPGAA